jgi:hypothetical protein
MGYFSTPKLWPALIYGLLFSVGWALVQTESAGFWFVLGNAFTIVGGGLALITVIVYLQHHFGEFFDVIISAMNKTKHSVLAHELHGLNTEQTSIVRSQGEIAIGLRMTALGARQYIHSTMVPLEFVDHEFLPLCYMDTDGATHTAPINSWSDGKTYKDAGSARTLAREFTQHLISNGLATPEAGNQSAKLVGDLNVLKLRTMLGLVDRSIGWTHYTSDDPVSEEK